MVVTTHAEYPSRPGTESTGEARGWSWKQCVFLSWDATLRLARIVFLEFSSGVHETTEVAWAMDGYNPLRLQMWELGGNQLFKMNPFHRIKKDIGWAKTEI